jgi:hypothetical protein
MVNGIPAIGSRAQVWHGTAKHTSGGLKKSDLKKSGDRIVSKKASAAAAKSPGFKALKKGGFVVGKGKAPLLGKKVKKSKK